ncbi:MAG: alpha/beta hydrolase [Actinomycetota bacterium]|nr:alpha/beta hydrolase [Actinomycetota bacterium]
MKNHLVEVSDSVSIATTRHGSSEPEVVLVHGLASNRHMYDLVAEELEEMGISSLSLDQRGHGDSSKPDQGYDHKTLANDVATVVKSFGNSHPKVMVGQSWGGAFVSDFAINFPDLVSGLVLIDGGIFDLKERFDSWDSVARNLAPPKFSGVKYEDLEERIASGGWTGRQLSCIMENFENVEGEARPHLVFENHMKILKSLYEYTPSSTLPFLSIPKLALLADRGNSPLAQSTDFDAQIAKISRDLSIEIREINGARHDLHLQYPKITANAIQEILQRIKGSNK